MNNKVSVNLQYRVNCQQNFYGATCFEYCVASDNDIEGHYTCDPSNGSVICRDGYEHLETFCVDRELSWLERGVCMYVCVNFRIYTVLDTMKAHIFVLHLHLFSTN